LEKVEAEEQRRRSRKSEIYEVRQGVVCLKEMKKHRVQCELLKKDVRKNILWFAHGFPIAPIGQKQIVPSQSHAIPISTVCILGPSSAMNTELGQFISEQIKLKKNFRLLSNIKSNIFKIKSYVKELKKKVPQFPKT